MAAEKIHLPFSSICAPRTWPPFGEKTRREHPRRKEHSHMLTKIQINDIERQALVN